MDPKELCDTVLVLGLNYDSKSTQDTSLEHQKMERKSSTLSLEPSLTLSLYDDKYDVPKVLVTSPKISSLGKTTQQSPTESTISSFFDDPLPVKETENETESDELDKIVSQISGDPDEDANARKKLRLTKDQSAFLEVKFKEQSTLNTKQKHALAKQLNLRPRQVEVWFQNRRARTKLKQTQIDYEFLKKCCDSLTDENRRLQKELHELRATYKRSSSSSSSKLFMQIPKSSFTMCPSCQRTSPAPNNKVAMASNKSRYFNPFAHSAAF